MRVRCTAPCPDFAPPHRTIHSPRIMDASAGATSVPPVTMTRDCTRPLPDSSVGVCGARWARTSRVWRVGRWKLETGNGGTALSRARGRRAMSFACDCLCLLLHYIYSYLPASSSLSLVRRRSSDLSGSSRCPRCHIPAPRNSHFNLSLLLPITSRPLYRRWTCAVSLKSVPRRPVLSLPVLRLPPLVVFRSAAPSPLAPLK